MANNAASIPERITEQVVSILSRLRKDITIRVSDIPPDRELRELGLDSLGSVNLILAIESEFDIFIPQAEMVPQNFRSITTISSLIANLTS